MGRILFNGSLSQGEEVKGVFSNGLEQRAMSLLDSELDGHQTVSILGNKIVSLNLH